MNYSFLRKFTVYRNEIVKESNKKREYNENVYLTANCCYLGGDTLPARKKSGGKAEMIWASTMKMTANKKNLNFILLYLYVYGLKR